MKWPKFLIACFVLTRVKADFTLYINFTSYSNPSGLCAECKTTLNLTTPLNQIKPVCCDQQPPATANCNNEGNSTCDTRFRWVLRDFDATIQSRPPSKMDLYDYSPCQLNETVFECPVSEQSFQFEQGSLAFLGVPNPTPVYSTRQWTGKIQVYIEPVDSKLPNIIDSLAINLDNLQLGADFTEERMYSGYHNISHIIMSFRVECAPAYYDPRCTTHCLDTSGMSSCDVINMLNPTNMLASNALLGTLLGVALLAIGILAIVLSLVLLKSKRTASKKDSTKADKDIGMTQNAVYGIKEENAAAAADSDSVVYEYVPV